MLGAKSGRMAPHRLAVWMQPFSNGFSAPTWQHVLVLVAGAILSPGRRTVAAALRGWDHKSSIDSVPMTVYMMWFEKVKGTAVMPAKATKDKDPVELLADAVSDLETTFGTWKVPWGDVNRLERRQSGGERDYSEKHAHHLTSSTCCACSR